MQADERMPLPTRTVETTGLAWAVRSSFRRYVQRVAMGAEVTDGGVGSLPDGRFYFPIDGVQLLDREALDAEITFSGGVRFVGHAGMIDVRLGEFRLRLVAGEGTLQTNSSDGARDLVDVQVAAISDDGGVVTLLLASRLAEGAADLFDEVYPTATPFDDLELRAALES
ncbi:HtaA domain-containing protein [Agromyces sp. Marseille-P2726]|uniref:HtaA domain-containing protein n=1 Tax=Agromyces sp. Marseille-P2726 TaxID=2709132 RepID=UPI00156E1825|nr:HtaA domain-containing protein [Agromyces sp. Marseille-P2726]